MIIMRCNVISCRKWTNIRYDGQFSLDGTIDTHSHEIDLIIRYDSHNDVLRGTYELENITMEHNRLLGSFEFVAKLSNIANKADLLRVPHSPAQQKSLVRPSGRESRASVHRRFSSEQNSEKKEESTFNLNSVISAKRFLYCLLQDIFLCHDLLSLSLTRWSLPEFLVCWRILPIFES